MLIRIKYSKSEIKHEVKQGHFILSSTYCLPIISLQFQSTLDQSFTNAPQAYLFFQA
jgi:hypothetical protein